MIYNFTYGFSVLGGLSEFLLVLGLVGSISLFFFPKDRRALERSLGVLFTLLAVGGVSLLWRMDRLEHADRGMTPAQLAGLSEAMGQFPTVKFEVMTSRGNREANSLALKLAEAIKAGRGVAPEFSDALTPLPIGVSLVTKDAGLGQKVSNAIGRRLMEARIAFAASNAPELGDDTVRIVVGERP